MSSDSSNVYSISTSADITDGFVYRGTSFTSYPNVCFQPNVTFDISSANKGNPIDFSIGAWGTYSFIKDPVYETSNYREIDIFMKYSVKPISASLLFSKHLIFDYGTTDEVVLMYSGTKKVPLHLTLDFYIMHTAHGIVDSKSGVRDLYFETGYTFQLCKQPVDLFLGISSGVKEGEPCDFSNKFGIINVGATVQNVMSMGKIKLPYTCSLVYNPNPQKTQGLPAQQNVYLLFGITL